MTVPVKDKKMADEQKPGAGKRKAERPAVCEICGDVLERDPESGELYCPACYFSENQP
jgi:uncharacterized Zn finger protein (UPF0148 family)